MFERLVQCDRLGGKYGKCPKPGGFQDPGCCHYTEPLDNPTPESQSFPVLSCGSANKPASALPQIQTSLF